MNPPKYGHVKCRQSISCEKQYAIEIFQLAQDMFQMPSTYSIQGGGSATVRHVKGFRRDVRRHGHISS